MKPKIKEIALDVDYEMYIGEPLIINLTGSLLLIIDCNDSDNYINVINFKSYAVKYGPPDEETLNGHPLYQYGLNTYGFFEVKNSPWIEELKMMNRTHPNHQDNFFSDYKHYIYRFQDTTLEVVCSSYQLRKIPKNDLFKLIQDEFR